MSMPLTDPGTGRAWKRLKDVVLFSRVEQEDGLNVWPTFDGVTPRSHGANYANANATQLVYEQWTRMTIQFYLDHAKTELVAIEWPRGNTAPNNGFWSHGSMPASQMSGLVSGGGWPVTISLEYWTGPLSAIIGPPPTAAGSDMREIRGDVWANLAETSEGSLPGGTPTAKPPSLPLPPAVEVDLQQPGFQIDWTRSEHRADVAYHTLGGVATLTEARMHIAARKFLQYGVHLQVDALPAGGYGTQWTRQFVKIPGQDATTGGALWFTVDTTPVDDATHPVY